MIVLEALLKDLHENEKKSLLQSICLCLAIGYSCVHPL